MKHFITYLFYFFRKKLENFPKRSKLIGINGCLLLSKQNRGYESLLEMIHKKGDEDEIICTTDDYIHDFINW